MRGIVHQHRCSGSADVLRRHCFRHADVDVGAPGDVLTSGKVRVVWHLQILLGAELRKSACKQAACTAPLSFSIQVHLKSFF